MHTTPETRGASQTKPKSVLAGMLLWILISAGAAAAQPTLYLVRHAEKVPDWPGRLDAYHPLSSAGVATAGRIADFFADMEIAAVYSSETTRALHTALPLARRKGLEIETAAACADTAAIDAFLSQLAGKDGVHVLFTHSNIIPYLLIKAGLQRSCWEHAGIRKSTQSEWLLISGYKHLWRFKLVPGAPHPCSDYTVIAF